MIEDVLTAAACVALAATLLANTRKAARSGRSLSWIWTGRPLYASQEPDAFRRAQRLKNILAGLLLVVALIDVLHITARLLAA